MQFGPVLKMEIEEGTVLALFTTKIDLYFQPIYISTLVYELCLFFSRFCR